MKRGAAAYLSGFVFAIGLGVSGMTSPLKVIGFLDFAGRWDASLLLVMVSAVGVYAIGHRLVLRRASPVFARGFVVPAPQRISPKFVLGGLVFGVGWGLAGYCPGPAIVSIASGRAQPIVFTVGMVAGMIAHHFAARKRQSGQSQV
jgi:uncharacterized membrane protein YedE/YeeE